MAKKVIKIISIILLVMAITSIIQTPCYAAGMSDVSENVGFWKPKNEVDDSDIETEINDGYNTIYEYKFGYLLTRDCDLKDTELYKILGSPISVKNI